MKILFCSLSDRPILSEPMFNKLKEYCDIHNYKCILEDKSLDKSRLPPWSKIILLQREMKNNPDIELIVWIDDDIIITNKNIRFEDLIKDYNFDNILISEEVIGPFNTGILVCKNNEETYNYLEKIWNLCEKYPLYKIKANWEQDIFIKDYNESITNTSNKCYITTIPYKIIQSFYRKNDKDWKKGDFAAHITGMPLNERIIYRDIILDIINN